VLSALAAVALTVVPADLVIRGGRVIDGVSSAAYTADVAIGGGRVVAIGRELPKAPAEIDATGLIVAPGFIDVHTHAENVAELPLAENFIRMGVTTIVTGNCGSSAGSIAEFLDRIDRETVSVNVATLVGHNTVRRAAMSGEHDREPTPAELSKMKSLVAEGMKDGAVGLSTGLIYLPGTFAKTPEIVELAKVAATHGGVYASHMRNESTRIFDALNEVFTVAREAKIPCQISHIKLGGNAAWGQADKVLEAIEQARREGLDITQDQYVYTASSTGIGSNLIPSKAREAGREAFIKKIEDPVQKAAIVREMRESLARAGRSDYSYAVIASYRRDPSLNGKSIPQAALKLRGRDSLEDQIETILEIERNGGASGVFHGMHEDDLRTFLKHPNTMIASDGGVRRFGQDVPHPRSYGNNVRVLGRYVRELALLRLEEAIRRMTSLPATTFRLKDRGTVREGAWADLVVFDPAKVADAATFEAPHQYAVGIVHVLVNGTPVVREGVHLGTKPGKALRLSR